MIFPHLDERQRRLLVGAEARAWGRGGIRAVARAAGLREGTVSRGVSEVDSGADPPGRARMVGGGRKRLTELDPGLRPALSAAPPIPYTAHHEAELHIHRGGPSRRKPAGGHPPTPTLDEMLLITVLKTRFGLPRRVLVELFGTSHGPIAKAERQIRPLLEQHKHHIEPAHTSLRTLTEFTQLAAAHGITLTPGTKPARQ